MKLDALLEAAPRPAGEAQPIRDLLPEFRLDRGPMKLRVMVPADDVKKISLVEKTGERVENLGVARDRLPQLPGALRLFGGQPELTFFLADGESGVVRRRDGDGDEVDDVAVEDQAPRLALLAIGGVEVEEGGELGVESGPRGPRAGLQVVSEMEVGDRKQVMGALPKAAPHPLPDTS